jgi:hypothetical protein
METTIVCVDDAEYARKVLQPLMPTGHAQNTKDVSHWIVVACAPTVTNDVGKWVSTDAKNLWRDDWAIALFGQIKPMLSVMGNTMSTQLADTKLSLIEQTNQLLKLHNGAKVIDARRPKFGQDLQPVTNEQPGGKKTLAGLAAAVTVATVLAADF